MANFSSHVGIIGGGIAGLTAGCALRLQGIKTIVFERGNEISEYGAGISISPNALNLLEKLGIKDDFIKNNPASYVTPLLISQNQHGKEADELEYWLFICNEVETYENADYLLEKLTTIRKILNKIISSSKMLKS